MILRSDTPVRFLDVLVSNTLTASLQRSWIELAHLNGFLARFCANPAPHKKSLSLEAEKTSGSHGTGIEERSCPADCTDPAHQYMSYFNVRCRQAKLPTCFMWDKLCTRMAGADYWETLGHLTGRIPT
jgi:hypothetical protein